MYGEDELTGGKRFSAKVDAAAEAYKAAHPELYKADGCAETDKTKVKAVIKAVKAAHPYSVPEVIALPIKEGNRDYLKWIGESVGVRKPKPRTRAKKNRAKKQSQRDLKRNQKKAGKK